MAELIELKQEKERVILVGVSAREGDDTENSMKELEELAKTAGAVTVGAVIQNRESVHPATYVGKGKIDEIKELIWETDADGIICDDELTPAQMNNLQEELDAKVMDRTLLILDIFAGRAKTSEGKIQVELAQLKYRQSRLTGFGRAMSRLGGGIGTRGPGEKKLEMDRRLIKNRIAQLSRELKEVRKHREITRETSHKDSGDRYSGIHECGQVHAFKYIDRSRCFGGGSVVCYPGSNDEKFETSKRPGDPFDRYSRVYPETSPSSDRSIQEYIGRGEICGCDPACGGCVKPADGAADVHSL